MRLRKIFALVGALTVLGGCVLLYLVLDMTLLPSNHSSPLTRETHTNVKDLAVLLKMNNLLEFTVSLGKTV
jgi:hypothetical protein